MSPRVSVIIPVYNHEKFIGRAVDSVLGQTFRDFELIVVDDGSTDQTPQILARYADRIKLIRQANAGGAAALNRGIQDARAEWIAWLSSDDEWESDKLIRQIEELDKHPEFDMVFTDYSLINAEGATLGIVSYRVPSSKWRQRVEILRWCFVNGSTVLVRKRVFSSAGYFDAADRWAPDYEMWIRVIFGFAFGHLEKPLVRYREHPGQATAKRDRVEMAGHVVFSRAIRRYPFWIVGPAFLLRLFDVWRASARRVARADTSAEIRRRARMFLAVLTVIVAPERYVDA